MAGAIRKGKESSRRNLLKGLGAAAAGAFAGGMLSAQQAEAHGQLHVGHNGSDPATHGDNAGSGPGVEGSTSGSASAGVDGFGALVGVRGIASGVGVLGFSSSADGIGVFREGEGFATGVQGVTRSGVGVLAEAGSNTAAALQVKGKASFSTVGNGVVPTGQDSVFVSNALVTSQATSPSHSQEIRAKQAARRDSSRWSSGSNARP